MTKKYLDISVLDAAIERITCLFDEFDRVLVAFSGGKDSGVALELAYDYAKEHNCLDRLAAYFLDYEAQAASTVDYIRQTIDRMPEVDWAWLCLPVSSNFAPVAGEYWYPWDPAEQDNWLREMPTDLGNRLIDDKRAFDIMFRVKPRQSASSVRKDWGKWYAKHFGSTAVIVGLRADESLNRWRAIAKRKHTYDGRKWMSNMDGGAITAYPLYDWTTEDIWHYYAETGKPYSTMYDDCFRAGMPISEIREVYPFCFYGTNAIKVYRETEPDTWAKIVARCPAANFTAYYGDTEAMGYKHIALPDGHTWETYFKHLMTTLTDEQREHYQAMMDRRLAAVDDDTIETMYHVMCVAVLRNDYKGYNASSHVAKQKRERRKATAAKWRDLL